MNTAFLRNLTGKKITGLFIFLTFFGLNSFSNDPQHENHGEGDAVEHANKAHDEHGEEAHGEDDGKFNAGKMIMGHIGDAYDWHIMDINGHPVSIPLPIILYNVDKGSFDVFSYSRFDHGHQPYNGYEIDHETHKVVSQDGSKFYDLSMTKNVVAIIMSALLLCWIFLSVAKAYKKRDGKAPKGLQSLIEPIILFVRDEVAKPSIGKGYEKFMPFLLSIFFFIWLNNLLGLVPLPPGGANVTGNIAVTMVLALFTFIITHAVAKKAYWKHLFLPPVPAALYPLMLVVEIMGVFIKPFVLMVRLFANITAGHIIALGFMSLIFIFAEMNEALGYGVSVFSVGFGLFMSVLELLVAFIQAFVFTFLSALYFGAAVEEDHH